LGEALVEGPALIEEAAWLAGSALKEAVRLLELAAEVDRKCSVAILALFVAVWRWDGGYGGKLAVIGDQWSIASV
jgi:hypothetical protein